MNVKMKMKMILQGRKGEVLLWTPRNGRRRIALPNP